jgi:hypothetical protein
VPAVQVGIVGSEFETTGGHTRIDIDTGKVQENGGTISVEGNTIRIEKGPVTISVRTKDLPRQEGGRITGDVESVSLKHAPVEAQYLGPGMVSASFDAELTGLPPEDATIAASISEKPDSRAQAAFERAAAWKGQQIESVAYTLQVHKTHLEDIKDVGQATVSMSIAPSWALNRGGITNMKIARYADDGSSQLLDTQFTGLDSSQNMVFVGTSPGGLSIFALVAVKNSQVAIAPLASRPIFPSGEGTAPLAILPPLLLFVALTVIRRQS